MSDETTKEKQSFLSRTWVKVTAGVLGGTLILGGTFATGAMAGAQFGDMGPNRAFAAVGMDDRQMQIAEMGGREFRKHGAERGAGKQSTQSLRGLSDLSQEDRLDRVNEWLESLEIAPLEELPEDLAGTPEELQQRQMLKMLNKRLERLGVEPLDELPEGFTGAPGELRQGKPIS
jgi:hypothetical protein